MKRTSLLIAAALLLAVLTQVANACPFCIAPMQTWAEMVSEANVVILAKLISTSEGSDKLAPYALVEVITVHKGILLLPNTKRIRINDYVFGQPGELFLLKGSLQDTSQPALVETFAQGYDGVVANTSPLDSPIKTVSATVTSQVVVPSVASEPSKSESPEQLVWDPVERVSEDSFKYIVNAPAPELNPSERLKYFVPFLEHNDALVSADAWGEFANAQYQDITKVRELFPRDRLRTWISNKDTSPERLGLYGMLLGLCGHKEDAVFLRQQIGQPVNDDLRFGVEGMMGGLLLLEGEGGLQFLEKTRFQTPGVSGLECFAVVQALQFVWAYEPNLFPKQRLQTALHPMIHHPEMREIVIRNLARWEDWDAVSQLSEVYDAAKTDDHQTAAAVVGYLLTCQKSAASEGQKSVAMQLLDRIRDDNPRLVKSTERQIR